MSTWIKIDYTNSHLSRSCYSTWQGAGNVPFFSSTYFFHDNIRICTALMVGCDDVASCYSVGVLTRRQVDSWEGSREARVVADS